MTNRQVQRDAQRDRRREERQKARRELRQSRTAAPKATLAPRAKKLEDAPPPRRRPSWVWAGAGAVAALLVVIGIIYAISQNSAPLPGTAFASLGNQHVNPGDSHPVYDSNPPTSGWHYPAWPQRGVYSAPLPEESLLHFMEHAGVVIHYNSDKLPPDQSKQLKGIVDSELGKGQGLLLLAPDPTIPQPIAITSWQRLVAFDQVSGNKQKIQDAVERLQCNYDPEGVCGAPHGNQFYPTGTPAAGAATVIGQPLPNGVQTATVAPGQKVETPATPTP